MKLLFDQNISFRLVKKLVDYFPNCLHVSHCGLTDMEDSDIWPYSKEHGFTIVTFEADFYDISVINSHPPKVIWIRTGNLSTNQIAQLLINNYSAIENFLLQDAYREMACLELEADNNS
ncbi:MAG: DUF5615 family PIN-like protein [Imperialibacter sp.]|uniref:DUF5615 family PIN-like protein n=1 Tax=Imperialibacter sp. TaxID=2038411 RepID=UPI0032EE3C49